ncbi:Secreted repeat of unknown function [Beutenbergia cavernae DSM 12333]|uniref:Lipoprotein n=1 Tax=Beutenbergia cavernae (strain ATCC BAA-8 / DSM 12333 / CCUG 43141 / JCM 11478 / NBRC 16432 / NCIMB 13614 / HKI 0122) TaxID=471853 RepID=C5C5X8_BEUC1|nr:hypothetical protein [Beutenbergia cavernae]ACQ82336.1 Secreted repeat of unknown function [Beutenbergia cavernae DSM 12333]
MRIVRRAALAGLAAAALALAACSGGEDPAEPEETTAQEESAAPEEEAPADADLATADSDLGEIVVDGAGMTAYMFTNDTQGGDASACTGDCLTAWPPVIASSEEPVVDGVTGEVGTIETPDGELQLTLNGWPLYLFAQDTAAGDVNGQGANDVWYVLSPDGEPIMEMAG